MRQEEVPVREELLFVPKPKVEEDGVVFLFSP
jgi:hypothetical protein